MKNILFYSNNCNYSKEVIKKISESPLKDNLIYVCVDDQNIKLPDFLTAVPTIYLVQNKKILMDEEIINWIQQQNISKQENNSELQAYFGECNNSFGNNFCSIDNSERKPYISNFTFLDGDNNSNVNNNVNNNINSLMDSKLDQLKKSREDFAPIQRR